jgi:hypothetical protein
MGVWRALFSLSLARHMREITLQGAVPPASPNRLQYKYSGICSHLQHDAGPDQRNASFSAVITEALARWWETWSPFSTPRDVLVSNLATIFASWPVTVLQLYIPRMDP